MGWMAAIQGVQALNQPKKGGGPNFSQMANLAGQMGNRQPNVVQDPNTGQGFSGIGPVASGQQYNSLLQPGQTQGMGPLASGDQYGQMLNSQPAQSSGGGFMGK